MTIVPGLGGDEAKDEITIMDGKIIQHIMYNKQKNSHMRQHTSSQKCERSDSFGSYFLIVP
jgi:hypothetical protein